MTQRLMNAKIKRLFGFTLVEIMIVVTIIGILASLAVPAFQRARWKSVETAIRNNLRQIWGAAQQYMLENGTDSVNVSSIVAWISKEGTESGTNEGYTSVLQQVADEDYDTLYVYDSTSIGSFTTDETTIDGVAAGSTPTLTEDKQAIGIQVGTNRYVKLRL